MIKSILNEKKEGKIMIPIAGANCTYFEPSDSGGVCNHPDMRRGFWIFSYKENCILTHEEKIECELRMPKFTTSTPKKTKVSVPKTKIPTPTKTASYGTHKHSPKKHIHKHKENK